MRFNTHSSSITTSVTWHRLQFLIEPKSFLNRATKGKKFFHPADNRSKLSEQMPKSCTVAVLTSDQFDPAEQRSMRSQLDSEQREGGTAIWTRETKTSDRWTSEKRIHCRSWWSWWWWWWLLSKSPCSLFVETGWCSPTKCIQRQHLQFVLVLAFHWYLHTCIFTTRRASYNSEVHQRIFFCLVKEKELVFSLLISLLTGNGKREGLMSPSRRKGRYYLFILLFTY